MNAVTSLVQSAEAQDACRIAVSTLPADSRRLRR
jgi:hypothetical protein